jgi:hypothetical protein
MMMRMYWGDSTHAKKLTQQTTHPLIREQEDTQHR